MQRARILYLDAYDSFSNNIVALLKDTLPVTVEVVRIDDSRFVFNDDAYQNFLNKFDAVVAGPGPGQPENPDDVGLIGKLWHLPDDHVLPALGICLGFQSLALAFGAKVERLTEPRHGLIREVAHCRRDLFAGMAALEVTQYHSLHVRLDHGKTSSEGQPERWMPSGQCADLLPLAWDLGDADNGPILMGVRHTSKPFSGVQFHPESVCSSMGQELILNWWQEVCHWKMAGGREWSESPQDSGRGSFEAGQDKASNPAATRHVHWEEVELPSTLETSEVVNLLREDDDFEPMVLESGCREGAPVNPETGRFSIVALRDVTSLHVRWSVQDQILSIMADSETIESRSTTIAEVFETLAHITAEHKSDLGPPDVPFWGGLVGFLSYEAGLQSIAVNAKASADHADVWFVLIERTVVIDHSVHMAYVQSIRDDDDLWVANNVSALLGKKARDPLMPAISARPDSITGTIVSEPHGAEYRSKVVQCQDHLRAGSSYELCLTDQTLISNEMPAWQLYQKLRSTNPAPFGAYICLKTDDVTGISIISSSPERFLSWSRNGHCQFRPIKGTVKKTPEMTRARAEGILGSEKERAENLMIVDLIRHDLHGVEGVKNVQIPKLMTIEEYATVYQLVSVISGSLSSTPSRIAALSQSLPPGSMTGAPKKRSCELLQELENHRPRGLYSGVIGYLDVGGGADFSVVIRTAFRWDDEGVWRVGAGGAVTALSEAEAEWEEMLAKRQSLLNVLVE